MVFTSIFIAVYENMIDYVTDNIHAFLCKWSIKDGKEEWKETEEYKEKIKNRRVDDKGNKDITKASFLWLVDMQAISQNDYQTFIDIKEIRNQFAHELLQLIIQGVSEEHIKQFVEMILLYKKITNWWFINVEAEIGADDIPEDADISNAQGDVNVILDVILDVIYRNKSKEYQKIIHELTKSR